VIQLLRGNLAVSFATAPAAIVVVTFFGVLGAVAVAELGRVMDQQVAHRVRFVADRVLLAGLVLGWAVTMARHFHF
jgi:hypothetical protein